jgi:hypothetical protein
MEDGWTGAGEELWTSDAKDTFGHMSLEYCLVWKGSDAFGDAESS